MDRIIVRLKNIKNNSVAMAMQRFFKFFTRKILTVELVGYSLQIPLLKNFSPVFIQTKTKHTNSNLQELSRDFILKILTFNFFSIPLTFIIFHIFISFQTNKFNSSINFFAISFLSSLTSSPRSLIIFSLVPSF